MNQGTAVIVNLLGGVALLLWGVRMVRTDVMRAWGERLTFFIEHRLGSRMSAFAAGALATVIVGSGTATSLIVTNIAVTGALPVALGLAVLLGADVGSAVLSSVVASGSSVALWTSPIFLFVGYVLFHSTREFKPHNVGRILIGLGLMLLSLRLVSQATAPLNQATLFHDVLGAVGREPLLAFLVGGLMAWAFHSTLAAILLVASLLSNGSLDFFGAFGFILGINCGGSLPALTASLGLPAVARRLPVSNLICRFILGILLLAFSPTLLPQFTALPYHSLQLTLGFHVIFNVMTAILFLPLTGVMGAVAKRLLPDAVQNYLSDLSQGDLTPVHSRRALEITLYVSNLEHAGDIIHLNLCDRIKAKVREGAIFTLDEQASLDDLCLIIHDNIRLATAVLGSGDIDGAKRLIAQKDAFRLLENKVIDEHFKRGTINKKAALRRSALFIDIIRDLHRINSHIVSAGYPIVDAAGLLRKSRLRHE